MTSGVQWSAAECMWDDGGLRRREPFVESVEDEQCSGQVSRLIDLIGMDAVGIHARGSSRTTRADSRRGASVGLSQAEGQSCHAGGWLRGR